LTDKINSTLGEVWTLASEGRIEMTTRAERNHLLIFGYGSALITGFLLGLFPSIVKPIISKVNPLFFSSIFALTPIVIFALLSIAGRAGKQSKNQLPVVEKSRRRIYGIVLLSSFIGGVMGPIAYFFGLQTTPASDASLLANAEMVFTIVIASIAFREKLNLVGLVAVVLVTIGIIVVVSNLRFSSTVLNLTEVGHLLVIFSGLCWGLDNNIITYASERIDVAKFIGIRSIITAPVLSLLAFGLGAFPKVGTVTASDVGYIFLVALFLFGGSLYFNFLALKELGAIRSTLIFPLSSIFGLIAAFLVLHELISAYQIISVGVIILGIYLLTRTGSVRKEKSYMIP